MIFILKEYITHTTNLYILHVPKPRMENKHFIMSISSFSLRKGKIIMERSLQKTETEKQNWTKAENYRNN